MHKKDLPTKYELDLSRGILKSEGEADHTRLMQALQAIQALQVAQPGQPTAAPASEAPTADDPTALKLGELLEKFFLLRKQLTCQVPCDHIPARSWPLFRARQLLHAVIESIQREQTT